VSLRAILFDFNGILLDDEPVHLGLFQRVLAEEGVAMTAEDYQERWLGLDDRGCLVAALTHAGAADRAADADYVAGLIARKAASYASEMARSGFAFYPGAVELLREAAAAGWPVGVVSGALRPEIEAALAVAGVAGLVKAIVAAEDVADSKPDPQGYRMGLAALNAVLPRPDPVLAPREVLAIEDSPAGLEAATRAGLRTLGVAHTYPASQLGRAEARVERLAGVDVASLAAIFDRFDRFDR
jgi:HAD superfamily hydrolase (TIGR01509 family)